MADILGGFGSAFQIGQGIANQGADAKRRSQLSQLASQAYTAPQSAQTGILSQMAAIDPASAQAQQGVFQSDEERRNKTMANMAQMLTNAPEQFREGLYQQIRPGLAKFGIDAPPNYTPEVGQFAEQIAAAWGGAKAQEQYTLSPGAARYGPDGKLIAERPFAPVRPDYRWTDQGLVAVTGAGAVPVEMGGSLPGVSQAPGAYAPQQGGDPFGFLADAGATVTSGQRSPSDNHRVGGVPNSYHLTGQARDILPPQNPQQAAFIRQQAAANGMEVIDEGDHWHLEPSGSRGGGNRVMPAPKASAAPVVQLNSDEIAALGLPAGTVAQRNTGTGAVDIVSKPPASASKPPTEGERKAAGFLQRMEAAGLELDALRAAGYKPEANVKDYYTAGEGVALNWLASDEGQQNRQQQEDWVRAKLRLESGAVIADEEMDREIKTYFPQPGDSQTVIESKARSRERAKEQMRIQAGRAIDGNAPANGIEAGHVEDGYRFTGGDPADPNAWEQI